jgi:hypothetical protein
MSEQVLEVRTAKSTGPRPQLRNQEGTLSSRDTAVCDSHGVGLSLRDSGLTGRLQFCDVSVLIQALQIANRVLGTFCMPPWR